MRLVDRRFMRQLSLLPEIHLPFTGNPVLGEGSTVPIYRRWLSRTEERVNSREDFKEPPASRCRVRLKQTARLEANHGMRKEKDRSPLLMPVPRLPACSGPENETRVSAPTCTGLSASATGIYNCGIRVSLKSRTTASMLRIKRMMGRK